MCANDLRAKQIKRFRTPSTRISQVADELARLGVLACCLQDAELNNAASHEKAIDLTDSPLGAVLGEIANANPRYGWAIDGELVNVFPSQSVINAGVSPFAVLNKPAWKVLDEDLQIECHGIKLFMEFRDGDGPLVNLIWPGGDLRGALNAFVRELGRVVWRIEGNDGHYYVMFTELAPGPHTSGFNE